jgi:hypothetical protein
MTTTVLDRTLTSGDAGRVTGPCDGGIAGGALRVPLKLGPASDLSSPTAAFCHQFERHRTADGCDSCKASGLFHGGERGSHASAPARAG